MRDKEIIETYLKNLKEELMMYSDSLSEKSLEYINKLKKSYNHWEKDLLKAEGKYISHKDEDTSTRVDNDLYDMIDEYMSYLSYKNDYLENGSKEKLDMSHTELSHFLSLLSDMFQNISEHSSDNADERAMIKSSIKSIYQNFG